MTEDQIESLCRRLFEAVKTDNETEVAAREEEAASLAKAEATRREQAAAEVAANAERERARREQAAADAAAEKRAANVAHQKRITGEILSDIMKFFPPHNGIARAIVAALVKGAIRHCKVEY